MLKKVKNIIKNNYSFYKNKEFHLLLSKTENKEVQKFLKSILSPLYNLSLKKEHLTYALDAIEEIVIEPDDIKRRIEYKIKRKIENIMRASVPNEIKILFTPYLKTADGDYFYPAGVNLIGYFMTGYIFTHSGYSIGDEPYDEMAGLKAKKIFTYFINKVNNISVFKNISSEELKEKVRKSGIEYFYGAEKGWEGGGEIVIFYKNKDYFTYTAHECSRASWTRWGKDTCNFNEPIPLEKILQQKYSVAILREGNGKAFEIQFLRYTF